ncbi:sugar ABC transporter ATP-binding protein [Lacrimispora sp. NSJ-141]|uniref:Sugar ABC transporter ATP-binding protein n=1 Tax=Lientehia hominis TaxID=2897778 RepID=A0AAP2W828_9FIRM|nr:sugar ABC transporter ATP-binding protein [Lientehia hominis]MCD2493033.1 sugar ABC transporter ATP-binding protein [Lientehia hominis]
MADEITDNILNICNVNKSFPGVRALNNVSIRIRRGDIHGIVGENGAGKSTLMKILSGVYEKDSGTIEFDGETVENTTPVKSLRSGLSIIYQEFNLVNTMSVGENIFLGRFRKMKGMRGTHGEARKLLDSINCSVDTHAPVESLSVSEKQMVEIAKALSFQAKLIIMDEPSSSLTTEEIRHLSVIIKDLHEKGITIIYISHKLDEIFEYCDRVTIMRDGCVVDTKPIKELGRDEMIAKMVGRTIENEYPERPHCVGESLLEISNLNSRKLKNISFTLKRGEILGMVGLVGSGRTEIVRAIFGADKVKGLILQIDGKTVSIKKPADAKKAGIALVPEDRKQQGLILPFSVKSNISMAALKGLAKRIFLNRGSEVCMAKRQMESLAIKTPGINARVENLSGGNQQKCVLGRWLETDSRILILDEPTRGIDVGAKYEIYLLMKKIVENGGSIIMISSELQEVLSMSNRILTISDGRITGEFDPEDTSAEEIMKSALA